MNQRYRRTPLYKEERNGRNKKIKRERERKHHILIQKYNNGTFQPQI